MLTLFLILKFEYYKSSLSRYHISIETRYLSSHKFTSTIIEIIRDSMDHNNIVLGLNEILI